MTRKIMIFGNKKTGADAKRSIRIPAIILTLILACIVAPVLADVKYTEGNPDLSAYIAGTNEFAAGSDIIVPIVIENSGLNKYMESNPDIVARDDLPNTAKFVTVSLSTGNAPIEIKSDPQMIGDIHGQTTKPVVFSATINADAPAGTYQIPVEITYTTLSSVDEYTDQPMFKYHYQQNHLTLAVPLVIKVEVIPRIISATPDHLAAGADGYINLTLKNVGSLDGTKATVSLIRNGESPVAPLDNNVYIGDFPAGSTVTCQYRVSVNKTAVSKTYPVDVVVSYLNNEGDTVSSRTETAGVSVGNKVNIVVTSPAITMRPGSKSTIQVVYRNTGDITIRSAKARIKEVIPFTSLNDVVDLGDLAPGQTALANYQLSVTSDATPKEYGLDSEIRYTDTLNDTYVSDPIKVTITVKNPTGIEGIFSNTLLLSVIVIALAGLVFYGRRILRKKKQ
jgi:hypothetical protein